MCQVQERQLSHHSLCSNLPCSRNCRLILVSSITLIPLDIFWLYLAGMKRRISRCVACKRDNYHCLRYVVISSEAGILCRP